MQIAPQKPPKWAPKPVLAVRISRSAFGLLFAGLGLILLAVLLAIYLVNRPADDALQPTDFSAIPAAVHYSAPTLELSDVSGASRKLSEYDGQIILVNLWATWCPPCRAEMPLLQQFYERHRDAGFTVIAIEDGEPPSDVRSFVAQYRLAFPVWLDPSHEATEHAFKTMNIPTSYVIDRGGEVRLTWLGAISESNLEKYVTPLIEEK
jgi:cytochrome c biogenesis protein CcmG/thiol:disulfide interchange protein DsbE